MKIPFRNEALHLVLRIVLDLFVKKRKEKIRINLFTSRFIDFVFSDAYSANEVSRSQGKNSPRAFLSAQELWGQKVYHIL